MICGLELRVGIVNLIIKRIVKIFSPIIFCIFFIQLSFAVEINDDTSALSPANSKYSSWVFMGMVENEVGEVYNYFFQLNRNNKKFKVLVSLFDFQTKKVIFEEDNEAIIDDSDDYKWIVGKAFLRYNKITNSWIFGLKDHNKEGFNFKVSMLNKPEDVPVTKYFRDGITFVVAQAKNLNGHLRLDSDSDDQFVTARNTWFQQVWLQDEAKSQQKLKSLFCRFNDGRGLYSMKAFAENVEKDSIARFYDSDGSSITVSQFVNLEKNSDNSWKIDIVSPKMHFILTDIYNKNDVAVGFMNDNYGFCMLSQDLIELDFLPTSVEKPRDGAKAPPQPEPSN